MRPGFALLALLALRAALAQPGALDPSFGGDGLVVASSPGVQDYGTDTVVLPDGRILLVGRAGGSTALVRYLPDGSPDPAFGTDGIVYPDIGSPADAALQPDGKLVVSGTQGGQIFVARLLPSGALDPTFGAGGLVFFDLGTLEGCWAVALAPDGKIVVAGGGYVSLSPPNWENFLARLHPNGAPDLSFDGDGRLFTDVVWMEWDGGQGGTEALVVQPDGKVLFGGIDPSGGGMAVARLLPSGVLDPAFADGGVARQASGPYAFVAALALAPDGKIVVGARKGRVYLLARLRPNGRPDPTFGTHGWVSRPYDVYIRDIALQPDGEILLALQEARVDRGYLARHLADGQPDPSFGSSGQGAVALPYDVTEALALQPDGRILTAGYTGEIGEEHDFALSRHLGAGASVRGGVASAADTPSTFTLSAASPNPSRGAATVTLTLASAGEMEVSVYDVLGRRVAVLHAGPLAAGRHAFRLDGSALPPGVYVVRVTAGDASASRLVTVGR